LGYPLEALGLYFICGVEMSRDLATKETKLFTYLKKKFELGNSAALAEFLGVSPALLSKIRHGVKPYTAEFILTVYDKTDLSIEDIRKLIKV
jgi:transcriptional regulator with XRE-family HTH domain